MLTLVAPPLTPGHTFSSHHPCLPSPQLSRAAMEAALAGPVSWGLGEDAETEDVASGQINWRSWAARNTLTDKQSNQQQLICWWRKSSEGRQAGGGGGGGRAGSVRVRVS